MLKDQTFKIGDLQIVVFDFSEIGDELPLHVHTEEDVHISIVARGSLISYGNGWEKEIKSGDILDWVAGQYHGFKALEPSSRLVNVIKNVS